MTADPAVKAVVEAFSQGVPMCDVAEVAVAAARPIIEAEFRERIAADIEALADSDGTWIGPPDQDGVLRLAARIVRGGTP